MLSPAASSDASAVAMRNRHPPLVGLRSTSSPTASTRPVNISLDQHIGPKWFDAPIEPPGRAEGPRRQKIHAVTSDYVRRDIEPHEVHDLFVPRRGQDRCPTLQQQRSNLPFAQSLQTGPQGAVAGYCEFAAHILERIL